MKIQAGIFSVNGSLAWHFMEMQRPELRVTQFRSLLLMNLVIKYTRMLNMEYYDVSALDVKGEKVQVKIEDGATEWSSPSTT
ncbi:MAG: hypothetical protein IPJ46_09635 [Anaerolineales bacterium]|nr:hypothetical protein [Anaerolineales bacterium]